MQLVSHQKSLSRHPMPPMRHVPAELDNRTLDNENARRLWAAVLERAILDLQERTTRTEAVAWVSSNRRGVGSFQWICQQLDMDPPSVKQALLAMATSRCLSRRGEMGEESTSEA
ncbi:MAG: hypothetical protein HQM00_08815 [Magnetococcales bacterium]|nr:hypothetical protein [Magnetococcales bacterium]